MRVVTSRRRLHALAMVLAAGAGAGAGLARAEYLRIEQAFGGMECASCVEFVKGRLAKRPGVESVTVDEKTGSLVIVLGAGNAVKLRQVIDLVQQSGFTPKESVVVVRGAVTDGVVKVLESERLKLTGEMAGKVKAGDGVTTLAGKVKKNPAGGEAGVLEIVRIESTK